MRNSSKLFVLLFCVISLCYSSPLTFSFTGSLDVFSKNVGNWSSLSFDDDNNCSPSKTNPTEFFNYVAFNLVIDNANASYYFVIGSQYYSGQLEVFIYNSFNASRPCSGLYASLTNQLFDGPEINDGVNLVTGNYVVVVTSSYSSEYVGVFAIQFSPATSVVSLSNSGYFSAYYLNDNYSNCSVNDDDTNLAGIYQWTQQTTGLFDIVGIVVDSLSLYEGLYTTLYSGFVDMDTLRNSPCNETFITGTISYSNMGGIDSISLSANETYTLVLVAGSIDITQVAIQIIPTQLHSATQSPVFLWPHAPSSNLTECTFSPYAFTAWYADTFIAKNSIYIIKTSNPLTNFLYDDFTTFTYFYQSNNTQSPPQPCTHLIDQQITDQGYPVGGRLKIGQAYTYVVTDYFSVTFEWPALNHFRLYVITGETYVNNASFAIHPQPVHLNVPTTSTSTGHGGKKDGTTTHGSWITGHHTSSSTTTTGSGSTSTGSSSNYTLACTLTLSYEGCYSGYYHLTSSGGVMPYYGGETFSDPSMTVDNCLLYCEGNAYDYAGVQDSFCLCINILYYQAKQFSSLCNDCCVDGNSCGNSDLLYLSVYETFRSKSLSTSHDLSDSTAIVVGSLTGVIFTAIICTSCIVCYRRKRLKRRGMQAPDPEVTFVAQSEYAQNNYPPSGYNNNNNAPPNSIPNHPSNFYFNNSSNQIRPSNYNPFPQPTQYRTSSTVNIPMSNISSSSNVINVNSANNMNSVNINSVNKGGLCIMCNENMANAVLLPCNHKCCCSLCIELLRSCPLSDCKTPIVSFTV
eukprot:TRINITY_DN1202_c0_g1_i3.p1 TRINITY_DN1202_c0_g1~~TRINITY_DN1202_c0_g1_i3.p1  ORF type:complete len:797 (-),score=146.05 TRINITY_DN1202_c0_g1_i3:58-2448(-)